jgi:hypothetical protein
MIYVEPIQTKAVALELNSRSALSKVKRQDHREATNKTMYQRSGTLYFCKLRPIK